MSMPHDVDLILTLAGGLTAATVLGFFTQKLRLSPLVGYLLAGVLVGPHSPGFVADAPTASQCAEIGIILLTEKFGREFPELIDEVKLHHKTPLIIEIPDRHGTGRKPDFITSYVNEAIGLKL